MPLIAYDIPISEINEYRKRLISEMKKMGATDKELALVQDATIRNAIRKNRNPKDVACAILL